MQRNGFFHLAVLSTVLALSGCYDHGLESEASLAPSDYSPDYTYVTQVSENGRTKRVLVPEACLSADEPSPADTGPPRLPPGCANNYNLQRMVERKGDLKKGRPLGRAPAAPAARAARQYIEGDRGQTYGGAVRGQGYSSGPSVTPEPQDQAQ